MCTEVTKLDTTVMEVRLGRMSLTKEYACDKEYFNDTTRTYTLVGESYSVKLSANQAIANIEVNLPVETIFSLFLALLTYFGRC